jgi:hypothetical protein
LRRFLSTQDGVLSPRSSDKQRRLVADKIIMPRRPATVTQADIARAIRAAKQAGATGVEVKPDGTVLIRLDELPAVTSVEEEREIVL